MESNQGQQDAAKSLDQTSKGNSSSDNSKNGNQASTGKEHSDTNHPHEQETPVAKPGGKK